jgi:hypothetical protein
MTSLRSPVRRCEPRIVDSTRVSICVEQPLDSLYRAAIGGMVQSRPTLVVARAHTGASLQQLVHDADFAGSCGEHKRCIAVKTRAVYIRTCPNEHLH